MRQLIVGLVAALLATGVLVIASSSPAAAVCGNPDYPACPATSVGLTVSPKGDGPQIRTFTATVKSDGSTAMPRGRFVFRFKKVGGGAQFATRAVPDSGRVVLTRNLTKGTWKVRVGFSGKGVWQDGFSGTRTFTVKRPSSSPPDVLLIHSPTTGWAVDRLPRRARGTSGGRASGAIDMGLYLWP